jgi:hypothetical protein
VSMQRTIDRLERLVDDVKQQSAERAAHESEGCGCRSKRRVFGILELSGSGPQRVPFRTPLTLVDAAQGSLDVYWWPYRPDLSRSNVETNRHYRRCQGFRWWRASRSVPDTRPAYGRSRRRIHSASPIYATSLSRWDNSEVVVGQLFSTPVGMTANSRLSGSATSLRAS